jgi:tRNA U34 5-carboxymethylaminomethyl modifying GTPase MnmE/TrmE
LREKAQQLKELEKACACLIDMDAPEGALRVAAWGLVKAGKSSLLNMLSGHVDQEYFKTGAVRTTRTNQRLALASYELIDTPGLGIDESDSAEAFQGLDSADVVLFVHAPPGELDQEEIDLLARVRAAFGEETARRLVVVLTLLDKDQDGAMDKISTRISEQLQTLLGIQPVVFQVSNTRFRKGVSAGLAGLVARSGIPELAGHLEALAEEIADSVQALRESRQAARRLELLAEIERALEAERSLISRLKQPYLDRLRAFNKSINDLRKGFKADSAAIDKLDPTPSLLRTMTNRHRIY